MGISTGASSAIKPSLNLGLSATGVKEATTKKNTAETDTEDSSGETTTSTNQGGRKTSSTSTTSPIAAQRAAMQGQLDSTMNQAAVTQPATPTPPQDPMAQMAQMAAMQQAMKPPANHQPQQDSQGKGSGNDSVKDAIRTIAEDSKDFKAKVNDQLAQIVKNREGGGSKKEVDKAIETLGGKEGTETKTPEKPEQKTASIEAGDYSSSGFEIASLGTEAKPDIERDIEELLG